MNLVLIKLWCAEFDGRYDFETSKTKFEFNPNKQRPIRA